jgi:DNA end-binding protein Ku
LAATATSLQAPSYCLDSAAGDEVSASQRRSSIMSRVIWNGAISFSLIHIPVSLQSASRSNALDLDLLDRRDFSPVGYQRINKSTGKPVEWDDIVKGYKHEDEGYVVLSDEDFRLANVEATQTIDIQGFVQRGDIGPQYFETPYHLLPEPNGAKVYGLLHDALERSGTWAIGLVVIRTRQFVCAVLPWESRLLLNTLRYADELVQPSEPPAKRGRSRAVRGEAARPSSRETSMALKLVEEMRLPWAPAAFHDTYREDLMRRIEQKVKAGETRTLTASPKAAAAPRATNVVDLTALLRRSLETRRSGDAPPAKNAAARRRRATPPRSRRRAS